MNESLLPYECPVAEMILLTNVCNIFATLSAEAAIEDFKEGGNL